MSVYVCKQLPPPHCAGFLSASSPVPVTEAAVDDTTCGSEVLASMGEGKTPPLQVPASDYHHVHK